MNIQAAEVEWYKQHGRYPHDRIKYDSGGCQYVIGDNCWNRRTDKTEWIETIMHTPICAADIHKATGAKAP